MGGWPEIKHIDLSVGLGLVGEVRICRVSNGNGHLNADLVNRPSWNGQSWSLEDRCWEEAFPKKRGPLLHSVVHASLWSRCLRNSRR